MITSRLKPVYGVSELHMRIVRQKDGFVYDAITEEFKEDTAFADSLIEITANAAGVFVPQMPDVQLERGNYDVLLFDSTPADATIAPQSAQVWKEEAMSFKSGAYE